MTEGGTRSTVIQTVAEVGIERALPEVLKTNLVHICPFDKLGELDPVEADGGFGAIGLFVEEEGTERSFPGYDRCLHDVLIPLRYFHPTRLKQDVKRY